MTTQYIYLGHMSLSNYPQLVINTLVTLNNLTYYAMADIDSLINSRQEEIAQCKYYINLCQMNLIVSIVLYLYDNYWEAQEQYTQCIAMCFELSIHLPYLTSILCVNCTFKWHTMELEPAVDSDTCTHTHSPLSFGDALPHHRLTDGLTF